jgi:hypothetical protein
VAAHRSPISRPTDPGLVVAAAEDHQPFFLHSAAENGPFFFGFRWGLPSCGGEVWKSQIGQSCSHMEARSVSESLMRLLCKSVTAACPGVQNEQKRRPAGTPHPPSMCYLPGPVCQHTARIGLTRGRLHGDDCTDYDGGRASR